MILIVLSDIDSSPIHLSIIERLKMLELDFQVLIIGSDKLKIIDDLEGVGVEYSVIRMGSKFGLLRVCFGVATKILRLRPSYVYASGQFATLFTMPISSLFGVQHRIFTRHHSNLHHKPDMKIWLALDKVCNHFASKIVVVSKTLRDFLIENEKALPERVLLINNGIDLRRFQAEKRNSRFANTNKSSIEDPIRFGVVSRLTEWKGVEYTAKAFGKFCSKYPNSHLTVIGEKSDAFSEISKTLSLLPKANYEFISHCEDVAKFFSSIDIFVHVPVGPTEETFGLVYLEALATGISCIFTLSGVMHDLENPTDYCEIVPYRDSNAIYEAMLRHVNLPNWGKSQVPDHLLEYYSMERMSIAYTNLLIAN
jgi:glycosyltransferase involved in cell wall biosynthesis